jgi:hypothetical protein
MRTAATLQLLVPVLTLGAQLGQSIVEMRPAPPHAVAQLPPALPIQAQWPKVAFTGGTAVAAAEGYVQGPPHAPVDPGEAFTFYVRPRL